MQKQIRIIVVDDHKAIRDSWNLLLGSDARFDIVALCKSGDEAITRASELMPDVMLMDINMSPVNGFEATVRIMEESPSVKIIGVSANNHSRYADRMLELGAKGFVTKSSPFTELKTAIVKVHSGEDYVCDEIRNDSSQRER